MAIVKNESKAYGYKYSSLADLEKAGIEIPIMRTTVTEWGEYVEWLDKDGTWQQGAKVIEMEMKGMNPAQAYGSALTYARRYTVQLAMAVACDDDKNIETKEPATDKQQTAPRGVDVEYIKSTLTTLKSEDEINNFALAIKRKHPNMTEKQQRLISVIFSEARKSLA